MCPSLYGAADRILGTGGTIVVPRRSLTAPTILSHDVYFCQFDDQVQQKLNRVATASGSANPSVAIVALLDVMAEVNAKNAEQVEQAGDRRVARHPVYVQFVSSTI